MRSIISASAALVIAVGLGTILSVAGAEEGVKQSAGHQYVVGVSGMR